MVHLWFQVVRIKCALSHQKSVFEISFGLKRRNITPKRTFDVVSIFFRLDRCQKSILTFYLKSKHVSKTDYFNSAHGALTKDVGIMNLLASHLHCPLGPFVNYVTLSRGGGAKHPKCDVKTYFSHINFVSVELNLCSVELTLRVSMCSVAIPRAILLNLEHKIQNYIH